MKDIDIVLELKIVKKIDWTNTTTVLKLTKGIKKDIENHKEIKHRVLGFLSSIREEFKDEIDTLIEIEDEIKEKKEEADEL